MPGDMATAKDLMRTDVVYLRINADYNDVNELLDKYHLQSYPVVEAGLSFSSPPPPPSPLPFPPLPLSLPLSLPSPFPSSLFLPFPSFPSPSFPFPSPRLPFPFSPPFPSPSLQFANEESARADSMILRGSITRRALVSLLEARDVLFSTNIEAQLLQNLTQSSTREDTIQRLKNRYKFTQRTFDPRRTQTEDEMRESEEDDDYSIVEEDLASKRALYFNSTFLLFSTCFPSFPPLYFSPFLLLLPSSLSFPLLRLLPLLSLFPSIPP